MVVEQENNKLLEVAVLVVVQQILTLLLRQELVVKAMLAELQAHLLFQAVVGVAQAQ